MVEASAAVHVVAEASAAVVRAAVVAAVVAVISEAVHMAVHMVVEVADKSEQQFPDLRIRHL